MSTKLDLKYPLSDGGSEINSVTLRRPKVRDMLTSDNAGVSDAQKEVTLFANLCDLTPELIEGMDIKDYKALQLAYADFLD